MIRLSSIVLVLATIPCFADTTIFECAKDLAVLNFSTRELGPIFTQDGIAFTSLSYAEPPASPQKRFVVITKNEILSAPLGELTLQKLSFYVNGVQFYINYMHGEFLGNRYFEFIRQDLPIGKSAREYKQLTLTSAPEVKKALFTLMSEQLDQTLKGMSDGAVDRTKAALFPLKSCQQIATETKDAEFLRNISYLNASTRTKQFNSRAPASLPPDPPY
jgi:hypothetical protein